MPEAYIVDHCRTPRGIGKVGKGALADLHPQHLGAAVLSALRERTKLDTARVDDIIWGCSNQQAKQGSDLGRMSGIRRLALDMPLPAIEIRQAVGPHLADKPAAEALADYLFL